MGIEKVKISRCFGRGEFGPWFESEKDVVSYSDAIIQKTLTLGPVALENFIKWHPTKWVTSTIFHKIFSNLQHDWDYSDELYMGWLPYKFGPIPIWPTLSGSGYYPDYKSVLLDTGYIEEEVKQSIKSRYKLYRPNEKSPINWKQLFNRRTDPFTRTHVALLTRLYANIQQNFKSKRLKSPYSDLEITNDDALVVLSAARNERIAYICSHYELAEWIRIGKDKIIPQIQAFSFLEEIPDRPYLKTFLAEFEVPVRLMLDKIEMYRSIGTLYKKIKYFQEKQNVEIAEVLLDNIDKKPKFRDDCEYPMKTLRWFLMVMFSYTFMLRQIMTSCNLDIDQRYDYEKHSKDGKPYDANFYLA